MALTDLFKRLLGRDGEPCIQIDLTPPKAAAEAADTGQAAKSGAPGKERRASLRVCIPELEARLKGQERSLPVRDVSVTGAGFVFKGKRIKAGTTFRLDLALKETVYAEGLRAKVMRHDEGVLGVVWLDLDRHQDEGLHKVVLEAQKRQASLRRGRQDRKTD